MGRRWASATVLKAIFNLCFIAMFLETLGFAEWVFASTLTWHSPLAHLIRYFAFLLTAQAVALVFYFRMPWVGALVSWISVAVILARVIPWGTPAWRSTLLQFRFELLFLALAHGGLATFVMGRRAEAEEIAEVTDIAEASSDSGDAQS